MLSSYSHDSIACRSRGRIVGIRMRRPLLSSIARPRHTSETRCSSVTTSALHHRLHSLAFPHADGGLRQGTASTVVHRRSGASQPCGGPSTAVLQAAAALTAALQVLTAVSWAPPAHALLSSPNAQAGRSDGAGVKDDGIRPGKGMARRMAFCGSESKTHPSFNPFSHPCLSDREEC